MAILDSDSFQNHLGAAGLSRNHLA
jgi:hypothetical protein